MILSPFFKASSDPSNDGFNAEMSVYVYVLTAWQDGGQFLFYYRCTNLKEKHTMYLFSPRKRQQK